MDLNFFRVWEGSVLNYFLFPICFRLQNLCYILLFSHVTSVGSGFDIALQAIFFLYFKIVKHFKMSKLLINNSFALANRSSWVVTLSQFLLVFLHAQEVFSLFGGWCYISLATYKIKLSELVSIPLLGITGMQPNRLSKSPRHSWLRMECKKMYGENRNFVLLRVPYMAGT